MGDRYSSAERDVLCTRVAICVLYPLDANNATDTIEYFLDTWCRTDLDFDAIELAIRSASGRR